MVGSGKRVEIDRRILGEKEDDMARMRRHDTVVTITVLGLALTLPVAHAFAQECPAQPPAAGTYRNCGSKLGCNPGETNVTVWVGVPPGDYIQADGIPPCAGGELTSAKLQAVLSTVAAVVLKDPNLKILAQPLTTQLAKRIDEVAGRTGGEGGKIYSILFNRGRYASCDTLSVVIPSDFQYRSVVLYAEDNTGARAEDLEGHGQGCGADWKGWGWCSFDPVKVENGQNGRSIASVRFRNWSHDRTRRAAVSFFLRPR